jgi:hypothetical protein
MSAPKSRGGKGMYKMTAARLTALKKAQKVSAQRRKQNTRQHNISSSEWGKVLKLAKRMRVDKYRRARDLSR